MTTQTETLKLSLEALEQSQQILDEYMTECVTARQATNEAITAIKEALAQPEQEPVAWMNDEMDCIFFDAERPDPFDFDFWKPLYTTPPHRKPLDMFEVETLAKQCGLEWSTKIQNLCDMVAMSVANDDISSERVDKEDENVHEPVAWLCKRKDGHFDVLTDQTCKKCFPVYTHPQKLGMTDEDFKNDRYA